MLAADPTDQFLRYSLAMELEKEGDNDRSLAGLRELQIDAAPYVPAFFMAAQQLVKLTESPKPATHFAAASKKPAVRTTPTPPAK